MSPLTQATEGNFKLSRNQLIQLLSFLENEFAETGLGTARRSEIWREIAKIKAHLEKLQKIADTQVLLFELKIRRIRQEKVAV